MIELSYVSLFSGIEAFSVAASRVEGVRWNPVFFSEIDPFPCAVLAHHFPQVPNLGDICKIRVDREKGIVTNDNGTTISLPRHGIDILAGGSPCQDVSVAGKRAGMEARSGTRSSLAFEYARLVEELRPRIILWENVPGVLSSNRGLDFAVFIRSLVECGYSLAWRVLDAQYTVVDGFPRAVPQRRKRVWLVGCLGADESGSAQILFERPGVLGDTPPRRQAGQGFAAPAGYCVEGDDRVVAGAGRGCPEPAAPAAEGTAAGEDGGTGTGGDCRGRGDDRGEGEGTGGSLEVAAPLCAADGKGRNGMDNCGKVAIVPALSSASFDGADVSPTLHRPNGAPGYSDQELFAQQGAYLARCLDMTHADEVIREVEGGAGPTPQSRMGTGGNQVPLVMGFSHVASGMMLDSQPSPTSVPLKRSPGGEGAVCVGFKAGQSANGGLGEESEVSPTMSHQPSALEPTVAIGVSFDGRKDAPVIPECAHTECVGTNPGFKNGVATMLKVRCGKDTYTKPDGSTGTAGKGPLASEESAFTLAATQDQTLIQQVNTILEDNHANATKTNPGEILRVLREALGEKAFEEWAARIAAPLWTKEVLRHEVHGEGIRREACEAELGQVNGALALSEDGSAGTLRDVRQAECERCSPQGRELSQQHDGELDSPMSQLSHQGSPQAEGMQDLWRTDEGARVLREALSALQEIRRSASMETQPAHAFNLTHIVRRLTPIECERLMALPDNYTRIPYRGKPADQCPDSPRYKALGNSMATNCVEWVLRRIVAAVRLGLIPEGETPCQ